MERIKSNKIIEEKEKLREEFDELFPKDQEAIDGIRISKSNRSAALVLWAKWEILLRKALFQQKEKIKKSLLIYRDKFACVMYEPTTSEEKEKIYNSNKKSIHIVDEIIKLIDEL